MSLIEQLEKLSQPQKLDEVFSDNKESILYDRLTASLREAAAGIKENILIEIKQMVLDMVQVQGLTGLVREAATNIKEELRDEVGQIVPPLFDEFTAKIRMPRDGEKGKDATSPNPKEVAKLIVSMLPKPRDGKDAVLDEGKIVSEVLRKIPRVSEKRGGGGSTIRMDDLSSQCNGSNKTFIVSYRIGLGVLLQGTQFPISYRPIIDYTTSGNTLILTGEVAAPEAGQSLIFAYIEG